MSAPLADTLAAAPSVQAAAEVLRGSGDIWVVGGAVRDAGLGRDVVDVDLAVARDPAGAASAIGKAAGGPAFSLSEEFATWRVMGPGWHVDVTGLRAGSIEADLALRDFTINS